MPSAPPVSTMTIPERSAAIGGTLLPAATGDSCAMFHSLLLNLVPRLVFRTVIHRLPVESTGNVLISSAQILSCDRTVREHCQSSSIFNHLQDVAALIYPPLKYFLAIVCAMVLRPTAPKN